MLDRNTIELPCLAKIQIDLDNLVNCVSTSPLIV